MVFVGGGYNFMGGSIFELYCDEMYVNEGCFFLDTFLMDIVDVNGIFDVVF